MLRRGLALVGAVCLVLSPGGGGLGRALAAIDVCGCNMGADCPMCKARRLREKREADASRNCPCRLQQASGGGQGLAADAPSFDPVDRLALAPMAVAERDRWRSVSARAPEGWAPRVPRRPPRALPAA